MFIIRSRKSWTERPVDGVPRSKHAVYTLVFHHTAWNAPTKIPDVVAHMRQMEDYHVSKGWAAIGYNIVIDRKGRVWEGRGLDLVPAAASGHNTTGMHVAVMGDYTKLRLTLRQKTAIRLLRARLRAKGYRFKRVCGHNQLMGHYSNACPGSIREDLKL